MKTSGLWVVVVVMQGLILLGQWTGSGVISPAHAASVPDLPDAAGQRVQTVEQLKQLNTKMDRLLEVLESGKLQVKVAEPAK